MIKLSLQIDIDKVTEVLLADGWHIVLSHSFNLDSYEFIQNNNNVSGFEIIHGGGKSGVCSTGFIFITKEEDQKETILSGPLTSILAVRYPLNNES